MCILVVEDEPLIRMILVEELIDAGYVVREAETGDQAFELLKAIEPPLTVLVTDVHMPGQLDGVALGAHVRRHLPHVPVIYTTGRPDALQSLTQLDDRQFLIRKPYVPNDVISQLRKLMSSGAA